MGVEFLKLEMLCLQVLKRLDLNDSTVQSVLLACTPSLEDPPSLQVTAMLAYAELILFLQSAALYI